MYALVQREQLERERWNREDIALRRDVLRRLVAYSYRLTNNLSSQVGPDRGEPFIALNKACIVYLECPAVIEALGQLKAEKYDSGSGILAVVKAMGDASNLRIEELDEKYLKAPFVPGQASGSLPVAKS